MKLQNALTAFVVLVSATSLAFAAPGDGQGKGKPGKKRMPTPEGMLKHLDKNGDGSISKAEAPERMATNFDRMDANSDGAISLDELKAMFKKRAEKSGNKPGAKGAGRKGKPTPENFLKRFDKDGNGSVSKNELPEKMQARFAKIDTNSDGKLDLKEIKALQAKMAARGGKGHGDKGPGGKKPGASK
ncbi:MAG: EF-hand domain-containing protein [Planctomycetaceae bacterium]|nr:EF-hand domain-containing protein [Planctomycetaceae bacterium]